MRGAAPELPSTTSTPTINRRMITGVNHHLLLWRMKYQNSPRNPAAGPAACRSKSLFADSPPVSIAILSSHLPEVPVAINRFAVDPVRCRRPLDFPAHGIVREPHQTADRGDDQ